MSLRKVRFGFLDRAGQRLASHTRTFVFLASDDQLLLAQSDKQPSDGNFGESASISNSP